MIRDINNRVLALHIIIYRANQTDLDEIRIVLYKHTVLSTTLQHSPMT